MESILLRWAWLIILSGTFALQPTSHETTNSDNEVKIVDHYIQGAVFHPSQTPLTTSGSSYQLCVRIDRPLISAQDIELPARFYEWIKVFNRSSFFRVSNLMNDENNRQLSETERHRLKPVYNMYTNNNRHLATNYISIAKYLFSLHERYLDLVMEVRSLNDSISLLLEDFVDIRMESKSRKKRGILTNWLSSLTGLASQDQMTSLRSTVYTLYSKSKLQQTEIYENQQKLFTTAKGFQKKFNVVKEMLA